MNVILSYILLTIVYCKLLVNGTVVDYNAYVPGNINLGYTVECTTLYNTNITITNSAEYLPLIIWVTNFNYDPWSKTSLLDDINMDSFLISNFNSTSAHYLFIPAYNMSDTFELKQKIHQRAHMLGISSFKTSRLLFSVTTISSKKVLSTASNIVNVLNSWQTSIQYFQIVYNETLDTTTKQLYNNHNHNNIKLDILRLDCFWPNCPHSPLNQNFELILGQDGCLFNNKTSYQGKYVLISTTTSNNNINNCTYEQAAWNSYLYGAKGVLMQMRKNEPTYIQIGRNGYYYFSIYIGSISYEDGEMLKSILMDKTQYHNASLSLISEPRQGYMLIIDVESKVG